MEKMSQFILATALFLALGCSHAFAFDVSFAWGNIPRCTSGNPGTVGSPQFKLSGVPTGTAKMTFSLRDQNAPGYNHGGGSVAYSGGKSIAAGAFKYKSPCPPGSTHTYVWTVNAYDKGGKKLGTATVKKKYP
jgi:phosphatidylethanolamine-binding protein (PEBP) family uncharacterized protein